MSFSSRLAAYTMDFDSNDDENQVSVKTEPASDIDPVSAENDPVPSTSAASLMPKEELKIMLKLEPKDEVGAENIPPSQLAPTFKWPPKRILAQKNPLSQIQGQNLPVNKKAAAKQTAAQRKMERLRQMAANGLSAQAEKEQPVEADNVEDQMAVANTFAEYKPAKLTIGQPHPDAVVETAALSSIPPTEITYNLVIPQTVINEGALSALQLESIIYASQAHEQTLADGSRAGFLIGDGAGVGKGRTLAGVIYENFLRGRKKAIWVSVSNDLHEDAIRDLNDIGANKIEVRALNGFQYGKITTQKNGHFRNGVIFTTYSSLISASTVSKVKLNTRLKQLVDWFGPEFDGCIIFDECHKAKHLIPSGTQKPTKTGMTVLELQKQLQNARVVYASATGASEPRNMAYMVRLGLWGPGTPFKNFPEFLNLVQQRGVAAMEIVAMDMKLRGMYIARQLSFAGVSFVINEVPFTDQFMQTYNESVKLWVQAREYFSEGEVLIENNSVVKKMMWGQFWSAHQRFFKYLCIASKVSEAVKVAKQAVEDGKCAVIGLQSTGEARTLDELERESELNDFVSTAKSVLRMVIDNQFPAPSKKFIEKMENMSSQTSKAHSSRSNDDAERNARLKRKILDDIDLQPKKKTTRIIYSDDSGDEDAGAAKIIESDEADSDESAIFTMKTRRSSPAKGLRSAPAKKPRFTKKQLQSAPARNLRSAPAKKRQYVRSDSSDFEYEMDRASGSTDDEESGSASDSFSEASEDSESAIGSDDGEDESIEEDSDIAMEMVRGRRGAGQGKNKTMSERVEDILSTASALERARLIGFCKRALEMKETLLTKLEEINGLPANTLDQLIDELGGPDKVAEMTGRKGRMVHDEDENILYKGRAEYGFQLDEVNLVEKDRFMQGEKQIAIISEVASSGISLQSDRRVKNQRRRVHITLELPWSADRAIQQFGRTHRSNQVNAPEYIFLISNFAGERRFASSVSKRLESLGALTHADRRATETRNLSQFNVDNKYGKKALDTIMEKVLARNATGSTAAEILQIKSFAEMREALLGVGIGFLHDQISSLTIPRFLNRILGLPVPLQNKLFDYFTDTFDSIIAEEKKHGRYDMGIQVLGNTETAEKIKTVRMLRKHATGIAPIEITTVAMDRGMTWKEAFEKFTKDGTSNGYDGFYRSQHYGCNTGNRSVFLALMAGEEKTRSQMLRMRTHDIQFQTFRPHLGTKTRYQALDETMREGIKTSIEEAEKLWNKHYEASARSCSHFFWHGSCSYRKTGFSCDEGMRRRKYTVLSGSIFTAWETVHHHIQLNQVKHAAKIIRLKTIDGSKIVGILLPDECVDGITDDLYHAVENESVETIEHK